MTDEEPLAFGALLRHLRQAAGLTQEELAEQSNLSERAIRHLERDHDRTPRLHTVRLLAQALALDRDGQSLLLAAARPTHGDRDVPVRPASLPRFLTPLIGREGDMAILTILLDDSRLVTVRGTGGVGKTRLALAVAEKIARAFDRVCFVELAPLHEATGVPGSILAALSIREQGSTRPLDVIAGTLRSGRTLLVLDNMEHLLPAGDIVLHLLGTCPNLSVLITSREALRVRGERVYTLGPLYLPEREQDADRSPAIRLFLDRAEDAGAVIERDESTVRAVVEICRRLDGLPLAIELAAAWAPILSPAALLDRLSTRLLSLDRATRGAPARQRTMRDTVAWSYDLLSPAEQALFRRLSVFADGCSLDAADAVCPGVGPLELDTLSGLASLVDKSLLAAQDAVGAEPEPRFGLLEMVREFAHEKLLAAAETDAAWREHTNYFMALVAEAERQLTGPQQSLWLARLEREHGNLRSVLSRAQQTEDIGLGLELTGRLWPFWWARNHYDEAQKWLEAFLPRAETAEISLSVRARALCAAGVLACVRVDSELPDLLLREALVLSRQAGDDACAAATLSLLGAVEQSHGNYHLAEDLYGDSLATYQQLDDRAGVCEVLSALAGIIRYQGYYERAVELYQKALAISRMIGDSRRVADVLARLGSLESERGRPLQSRVLFEEALALRRELGDTSGVADIQLRSGEAAADSGAFEEAMALYRDCIDVFRGMGSSYAVAYVQIYQAEAALSLGDLDGAQVFAEECLVFFRDIGDRRSFAEALLHLADVARERQCYEQALALYKQCLTLHRELNTRPQIAQCLERMALLESERGSGDRVAHLCGAAAALRDSMDCVMAPAERAEYVDTMARQRRQMEAEAFGAKEAEGYAMGLYEAVVYALDECPAHRAGV